MSEALVPTVITKGETVLHKLTIYPLGNADCCLIDLENRQKILFDYANVRDSDDDDDLRIDLPEKLREDLEAAKKIPMTLLLLHMPTKITLKGFQSFSTWNMHKGIRTMIG